MPPGFHRREMLRAALGLAALPLIGSRAYAADEREGGNAMAKDIVMIHGANEGGWCFDKFKAVFESLGWTCHAPDLIGHGTTSRRCRQDPGRRRHGRLSRGA